MEKITSPNFIQTANMAETRTENVETLQYTNTTNAAVDKVMTCIDSVSKFCVWSPIDRPLSVRYTPQFTDINGTTSGFILAPAGFAIKPAGMVTAEVGLSFFFNFNNTVPGQAQFAISLPPEFLTGNFTTGNQAFGTISKYQLDPYFYSAVISSNIGTKNITVLVSTNNIGGTIYLNMSLNFNCTP